MSLSKHGNQNIWQKITQSSFYIKWTNWEFYPIYIVNIPTVLFWLYFAIRSRRLFFFSAVNPVIETGGVLGESKMAILKRLPEYAIPTTFFVEKKTASFDSITETLFSKKMNFPLICKPDIGERGFLVEKIHNNVELLAYLEKVKVDFIIQDFINYPQEVSVLYYRMPHEAKGEITSVCIKKNLSIVGNGHSTVEVLMQNYPRARFQLKRFRKDYPELLAQTPLKGEEIELEPIGNHCRGTTFLNGNYLINDELRGVFDTLAANMKGIHYGRFDMKCKSFELLLKGEGFKVLEFNGIASEPAHIYDPKYSIRQAYRDIFKHWKIIYDISKIQRKNGVEAMSLQEAYSSLFNYFKYMRSAKNNI